MDLDRVRTSFEHLYGRSMEEEPGSRPILGRFFVAHVTPDWAAEVPEGRMVAAASAMSAMHCALERGDYAEALAQLKAWAGLPGWLGETSLSGSVRPARRSTTLESGAQGLVPRAAYSEEVGMLRLIRLSRLLALIALLLIGLGGARAIPAVQGAPALVKVAPAHVLVTAGGKTLYVFAMDRNGMSACTGACAQVWPPLLVPSGRPALEAMPHVPGKFGLLKRAGSTDQLTYDGAPLYTYARDRKAGDMLGQGVAGLWWAVVAPGM